MSKIIKEFIENNKDSWSEGALEQVEKVLALVSGDDKKFTCNNGDYAIYYKDEREYGGHEGCVYTIDTDEFNLDTQGFLEFWTIPTVEGPHIDMWLIEHISGADKEVKFSDSLSLEDLKYIADEYAKLVNEHADLLHFKEVAMKHLTDEQLEKIVDEMENIPETGC